MKKTTIILSFVLAACLAAWVPNASAFSDFGFFGTSDNCRQCHTNVFSHSGDPTHVTHAAAVGNKCYVCHDDPVSTSPFVTPAPTPNCVQCHNGAGLREHHRNAGFHPCAGCHASPETPDPENTIPPGYPGGTNPVATIALDPCDGSEEQFGPNTPFSDGSFTLSLDNDGDLLYDMDDPDCNPVIDPCAGVDCDDGDVCNGTATCVDGGCVAGTALDCDDNNLCTTDSCDAALGCLSVFVTCPGGASCDPATGSCVPDDLCAGKLCDDQDACTDDSCVGGNCIFTPISCDDGVACTVDSCDAGNCVNTPVDASCADDSFCNGAETCNPASGCEPGSDPCPDQDCDEVDKCVATGGCSVDDDCAADEVCDTTKGACVPAPPMTGEELWTANCAGCHSAGKPCRTADQIDAAIAGNVGGMGSLNLDAAQIQAIADFLGTDPSCDDGGTPTGPPDDHTDDESGFLHRPGKERPFTNGCTTCHGDDLRGGFGPPSCFTCHGMEWDERGPGTGGGHDDDSSDDGSDDDDRRDDQSSDDDGRYRRR